MLKSTTLGVVLLGLTVSNHAVHAADPDESGMLSRNYRDWVNLDVYNNLQAQKEKCLGNLKSSEKASALYDALASVLADTRCDSLASVSSTQTAGTKSIMADPCTIQLDPRMTNNGVGTLTIVQKVGDKLPLTWNTNHLDLMDKPETWLFGDPNRAPEQGWHSGIYTQLNSKGVCHANAAKPERSLASQKKQEQNAAEESCVWNKIIPAGVDPKDRQNWKDNVHLVMIEKTDVACKDLTEYLPQFMCAGQATCVNPGVKQERQVALICDFSGGPDETPSHNYSCPPADQCMNPGVPTVNNRHLNHPRIFDPSEFRNRQDSKATIIVHQGSVIRSNRDTSQGITVLSGPYKEGTPDFGKIGMMACLARLNASTISDCEKDNCAGVMTRTYPEVLGYPGMNPAIPSVGGTAGSVK